MRKTRLIFTVFLLLILGVGLAAGEPTPKYIDMKDAGHAIHAAEFTKENNGIKFDKDITDATHFKVKKDKAAEAITVSLEDEKSETHKQSIGIPLTDIPGIKELPSNRQYLEVKHYAENGTNDYTNIIAPIIIGDAAYIDVEFTSVTITVYYSQLKNWNFESWSYGATGAPDYWSKANAGGLQSTDAKIGSYSYKITGNGNAVRGQIEQSISGLPTGTYVFGMWVKATGVTSGTLNLDLYNSSQDTTGVRWTGNTDWRWVEYTETINVAGGTVRIFVDGTPNSGSEWYIDGVILSRTGSWTETETSVSSTKMTQSTTYYCAHVYSTATYVTYISTKTFTNFNGCTVSATIDGNGVSTWTANNKIYVDTSGLSVGTHTIVVTVEDSNPLTASGSASKTSINTGASVQFTDTSTGSPETWSWNFGDGTTSTLQNPAHTYTSPGTYTVTLTTTKSNGWATTQSSTVATVTVTTLTANFAANATSIKAGEHAQFTDTSTGLINTWSWDFGDGTTSTLQNPLHRYTKSGTYTVTLTASSTTDGVSNTKTATNYMTVTPLVTDFTADKISINAGESVQFTDTTTNPVNTWYWDFGDGTNSTLKDPSHIYVIGGAHTVNLTTSITSGDSNTRTRASYINVAPLLANFTADRTSIKTGESIQFTDTSTCSPTVWLWNFGDGTTSPLKNPSHTYTKGGNYTVNLTATITAGAGVSSSKSVSNCIAVAEPVGAAFSAAPMSTIIGETVYFNDLSTGTGIDSWLWNFGDGNTSTEQFPEHTYGALGTYDVSLTVNSSIQGTSDTETKLGCIIVQDVPVARFEANPVEGDIPLNVNFRDTSIGAAPTSWYWDFGDGGNSISRNVSHTYGKIGTYTVTLTVSNTAGTSTASQINCIRTGVYESATRPSFISTAIKKTRIVNFTDTSTGDVVSRTWNFGDGNTSTAKEVSYTYANDGKYDVTLTVVDLNGTSFTENSELVVGRTLPPENYSNNTRKMFTRNMTIWDLPQNTMAIYTSYIPVDLFWLIIMIIMFLPLYIRTGSILLPCILYLFTGGYCAVYMPAYFSTMALWMTLLGVTGTIYKLFIED